MGIWQRLRGVEKRQAKADHPIPTRLFPCFNLALADRRLLPGATAAIEAASSFVSLGPLRRLTWFRKIRSRPGALDPHTCDDREVAGPTRAVFLAAILVDDAGTLRLAPAASFDVSGNADPETWIYRLSLAGPARQTTLENVPGAGVINIRYTSESTSPWRGVGPLQSAHLAGRLSAEVSTALADEFSGPRGALLPASERRRPRPYRGRALKGRHQEFGRLARFRREHGRFSFGTGPHKQRGEPVGRPEESGRRFQILRSRLPSLPLGK